MGRNPQGSSRSNSWPCRGQPQDSLHDHIPLSFLSELLLTPCTGNRAAGMFHSLVLMFWTSGGILSWKWWSGLARGEFLLKHNILLKQGSGEIYRRVVRVEDHQFQKPAQKILIAVRFVLLVLTLSAEILTSTRIYTLNSGNLEALDKAEQKLQEGPFRLDKRRSFLQ